MCECILSSALQAISSGLEGTPLNVAVTVTSSDEVIQLRDLVASLRK